MTGTIKKIVEGKPFGFISVEGRERDLFFHKEKVTGGAFEDLREGDTVSFDVDESGEKGPAAVNVQKAA
jgi:cold shock CspA family protein